MYGLMISIGIITAVYLFMKRGKDAGYDEDPLFNMAIIAIICGVIGSKLLFILTDLPDIIKEPSIIIKDFGNGFVFYGAVIGGIIAAYIYVRIKKWRFLTILDLIIPSVPLAQAFGRIGCFFAGCCYGIETSSFLGLEFNNSPFAPHDVQLLPTQVFSSIGNFIIFGILLWFDKKIKKRTGQTGAAYLILYSIARFTIEFFRGDFRGTVLKIFSTSQFICIFVFIAGIILMWKAPAVTEKKIEDTNEDVSIE
jgi:prolipoprotein diacylglyceryl transferase